MENHGEIHGKSWGNLWKMIGNPWKIMGKFHGKSWGNSMENHGETIENDGKSMEVSLFRGKFRTLYVLQIGVVRISPIRYI